MGIPVGIDLGTSTSGIAVFRDGKPEFLRDIRNSRGGLLPSVVALGPMDDLIVGETARRHLDNSVREVKRLMGTEEAVSLGGRNYRPQEISARILRHLKENAERILGELITEAVITVPASFRDRERAATMDAGELAGLRVERIINEPTAAALSYGLSMQETDQHVLVFDLGGGTFDASILEMFRGVFEVKASAGDSHLGGVDFDNQIVEIILKDLQRQVGFDVSKEPDAKQRAACHQLAEIAERAKIGLSAEDATVIDIPYLADRALDFRTVLSRREFEVATKHLVIKTEKSLDRVLGDAGLAKSDVDVVILVGGATRIPAVREFVGSYFEGQSLPEQVPPDEAVALGAAVQAALKVGAIDHATGMIVTDVTSHSLGVSVVDYEAGMQIPDRMSVIIPRQTTIPVERSEDYATMHDGQSGVVVRVFQGESRDVAKNELLDEFTLGGIPPAPAGTEGITIRFSLDTNARLDVTAQVQKTGGVATITIEKSFSRMTADDKAASRRELDQQWQHSQFYQRVEPLIASAERQLDKLEGTQREQVAGIVDRLKEALARNDEAAVEELDEQLTDILFEMQ